MRKYNLRGDTAVKICLFFSNLYETTIYIFISIYFEISHKLETKVIAAYLRFVYLLPHVTLLEYSKCTVKVIGNSLLVLVLMR